MSIVFAILIELAAIGCAVAILFAGNMRTTGGTSDDTRSAGTMLLCGTFIAVLVGSSHWVGW